MHDIRAFAASRAFLRWGFGVKSCKLVTGKLTLPLPKKDNNTYLGLIVAAQQILDPSAQTSLPRKKGGGGGGGTSAPTKSSGV